MTLEDSEKPMNRCDFSSNFSDLSWRCLSKVFGTAYISLILYVFMMYVRNTVLSI